MPQTSVLRLILVSILVLIGVCGAEDVTVWLNDTRFATYPPGWASHSSYSSLCGGSRWTSTRGHSTSLTFEGELSRLREFSTSVNFIGLGISVAVNFILEYRGAIAQITLDGTNVSQLNTFASGVSDDECQPRPWLSGVLSNGNHTVTVTQLDAGNASYPGTVYTTTALADPTSYPKRKIPVGAIVGGVVAGVAILLLIGAIFLRRRRRSLPPKADLMDGNTLASEPTPYLSAALPSFGHRDGGSGNVPVFSTPPDPVYSDTNSSAGGLFPTPSFVPGMQQVDSSKPLYGYDTGAFPPPSPWTPLSPASSDRQLTQEQLNLVQRLAEQNVPGPALATVIESMVLPSETRPGGQPFNQDAPPGYDHNRMAQ